MTDQEQADAVEKVLGGCKHGRAPYSCIACQLGVFSGRIMRDRLLASVTLFDKLAKAHADAADSFVRFGQTINFKKPKRFEQ